MTTAQKIIKYFAAALAIALIVSILGVCMGILGIFGGLTYENKLTDDLKSYSLSYNIKALKIDVGATKLSITEADEFSVSSNIKNIEISEKDGVLFIGEDNYFGKTANNSVVKLYIPYEFKFEKADIKLGAGEMYIDTLSADTLSLKLDAGKATVKKLYAAEKSEIDGGAGEIKIYGGTLNNLNLNMGIGEISLTSAVKGKSEIDCGVGEADINLEGSKADYKLKFDKGIGYAAVNGVKIRDNSVLGTGENEIEIDGGVGKVKVDFVSE